MVRRLAWESVERCRCTASARRSVWRLSRSLERTRVHWCSRMRPLVDIERLTLRPLKRRSSEKQTGRRQVLPVMQQQLLHRPEQQWNQ